MKSNKLEKYIYISELGKLIELFLLMNEQRFKVSDTGINYRMINHWDKMGLIRFDRKVKNGNRLFSLVDYVWIKVVHQLREFGVKLQVISDITDKVYTSISVVELMDILANNLELFKSFSNSEMHEFKEFMTSGEFKNIDFNVLDFNFNFIQILIVNAIEITDFVCLIVFDDGDWFPFIRSKEKIYEREDLIKKETHSQIRINISEIVSNYIMEVSPEKHQEELASKAFKELKLLNLIKAGDYTKVSIVFKSKNIPPLEIKKSQNALKQAINALKYFEYKEITVFKKDNKKEKMKYKDYQLSTQSIKSEIMKK